VKHRALRIPLYGGALRLFSDKVEFARMSAIFDGQKFSTPLATSTLGRCAMFQHDIGVTLFIGWFCDDMSVLCHEALHAALFMVDRVGIDRKDDEALTYLTQWFFKASLDEFRRVRRYEG